MGPFITSYNESKVKELWISWTTLKKKRDTYRRNLEELHQNVKKNLVKHLAYSNVAKGGCTSLSLSFSIMQQLCSRAPTSMTRPAPVSPLTSADSTSARWLIGVLSLLRIAAGECPSSLRIQRQASDPAVQNLKSPSEPRRYCICMKS
jgi:hypothetical protein